MIITDKFVFLNYPKTGTTYARAALKLVYGTRWERLNNLSARVGVKTPNFKELILPKIFGDYEPGFRDQHGVYRQIPEEDQGKKVVSIIRDPFQRCISMYVFGWWKKKPPLSHEKALELFPHFPELSFIEFYELFHNEAVRNDKIDLPGVTSLGQFTRMFLVYYTADPVVAAGALMKGQSLNEIIPPISFLHQEKLSENLFHLLCGAGFDEKRASRVFQVKKRNVSSTAEKKQIPQEQLDEVASRMEKDERFIYSAFPEYGPESGDNADELLKKPKIIGR